MKELVKHIKMGTVDPETAGRALFAGNFSASEKGEFLSAFLESGRYEHLAVAIHCGTISKEYNHADYLTANAGAPDLDARYFHLLMDLIGESGLIPDLFMPLFVAVFSAPHDSLLHAWIRPVEAYVLGEAYRDYTHILNLLTRYDPLYTVYGVLMTADRKRTEAMLIERLLYGDGNKINFSAIRKLLLGCKIDVSYLFGPGYPEKELKVREAIVRLALLYKNDSHAAAFLERVRLGEPSVRIRKLVEKKEVLGTEDDKEFLTPVQELELMMMSGGRIDKDEFLERLADSGFVQIADKLFFSVYGARGEFLTIVVTNGGTAYDLDNRPYIFTESASIGVTHPVEIPAAFQYINRLNLPPQPFLQIMRPVYTPDGYESASNVVARLNGTVMTAAALQANIKSYGFRLLRGQKDEPFFSRAAFSLSGLACVIAFSSTDFSDKNATVRLEDARFYNDADFVRLGGKTYIEGTPSRSIAEIPVRMFSECIYALYCLGACVKEKV